MLVNFFETIGNFFGGIVGEIAADPELRGLVCLTFVLSVVLVFTLLNQRLAERVSWIIIKENGCHSAIYSRKSHRENRYIVRLEAIVVFVLLHVLLYYSQWDLIWIILFSLGFEYIAKWQMNDWEREVRDANIDAAEEYNDNRDRIEYERVMENCGVSDPEGREKFGNMIVNIQQYRRRTGKLGDITIRNHESQIETSKLS